MKDAGSAGRYQVTELLDGGVLNDRRKQPGDAQAYLIRRDAALTPLAYGKRMIQPVDGVLNCNWERGIRMISMAADIVVDCCDDLGATIASRPKATRSISQKLGREFHNARDSLSRYVDA
ncbi:hypothetical protein PI93_004850 [Pandoraea fibrosis]|uniref:Uncharacterized protein n=1 Tax=Pandoraea fibrosis TaxID=1891094 RepID=A0ABX6HMW1_9BURK|nr:hypothetical protein [Pandoraea fibrosis]QHE94388.1 hypothetical protein PJ20_023145 [Pandoraea fibrosis]QHF12048.1 hypothetical protein PI93_004850 [Pandoraea fibrosis]